MANLPPSEDAAALEARQLGLALDVIEARLDALAPGASPDAIAEALAAPVRAFDTLARQTLRPG